MNSHLMIIIITEGAKRIFILNTSKVISREIVKIRAAIVHKSD